MKEELEPRQIEFLKNYLNPKSNTFSNAYRSAIKAGFSEEYAKVILNQGNEWISENLRKNKMVEKAEKVLDKMLEMPTENIIEKGDEILKKTDTGLVKVKQDTAKFVAERLGKEKWSSRNELTGADGEPLQVAGFNYIKPNEENNSDNQTNKETTSSLDETSGQEN